MRFSFFNVLHSVCDVLKNGNNILFTDSFAYLQNKTFTPARQLYVFDFCMIDC